MESFGKLSNYRSIQQFYKKCQIQSRQQLLSKIYQIDNHNNIQNQIKQVKSITKQSIKKSIINLPQSSQNRLGNLISSTFRSLVQWTDFDKNNLIVQQISKIFNINMNFLQNKTKQQKRTYVLQKIHQHVENNIFLDENNEKNDANIKNIEEIYENIDSKLINPQEKSQAFSWLGKTNHQYQNLKPIFEQILMERIKLFDYQLSQLTQLQRNSRSLIQDIMKTSKSQNIDQSQKYSSGNFITPVKSKRIYSSLTNISSNMYRKNQLKDKLLSQKNGFCNIKIRDHSTFSLQKWTEKQQSQYRIKKSQYKVKNSKVTNDPILFQFVKKYTKTVKARENIQKKLQSSNSNRQDITAQQLKYLCATSLFLNKTLNSSQKTRYKNNVKTAGKKLISRLQFNIAQHIIQTYKIFMKRVFDLRAAYYEQLTLKRKQQYGVSKKKQMQNQESIKKKEKLNKLIKMYKTIVESQKIKMLLNPKILRWVNLFCQKIKKKAKINNKGLELLEKSVNFVKNLQNKRPNTFLISMKKQAPSAKILKRQNHQSYRSQTKKYVQSQKFYYEPKLQQAINKFNKMKINKSSAVLSSAYKKQLTGGPLLQRKKVHVNLSKKTIHLDSKLCLKYIIKIQSIWRQHYYRKIYLKLRDQKRKQLQLDFRQKLDRLWRIYPSNRKINFKAIQHRLNRFSVHIKNIAQPYIRTYRKPINLFTSFGKQNNFSLNQLKNKYKRMNPRRLSQFVNLVERNFYNKILINSYVLTEKQINSAICKEGGTVVWWAVKNNNYELVKKLLEGGGNPNAKNFQNSYCLHQAMKEGQVDIIFILLDFGADLNAKNNKKQTPLYFCNTKMLKLLGLQQGALNGSTQNSFTDNNCLFFKPKSQQIYPEHYY